MRSSYCRQPKPTRREAHGSPFVLIELPDGADDVAVPLMRAMAHVQPGHIHPIGCQCLQHLGGA